MERAGPPDSGHKGGRPSGRQGRQALARLPSGVVVFLMRAGRLPHILLTLTCGQFRARNSSVAPHSATTALFLAEASSEKTPGPLLEPGR